MDFSTAGYTIQELRFRGDKYTISYTLPDFLSEALADILYYIDHGKLPSFAKP